MRYYMFQVWDRPVCQSIFETNDVELAREVFCMHLGLEEHDASRLLVFDVSLLEQGRQRKEFERSLN